MKTSAPSTAPTLRGTEATLESGAIEQPQTASGLRRGDAVGRYVTLEVVGSGGMGVVHAAYDPDLDRKVALKLLRLRADGSQGSDDAKLRMVVEAQAMARLNHPNVVTVHDVGTFDGGVFIAMEYLGDGTLGQWTRAEKRSTDEIVALYVRAGRGLAAAHAAGLVHGDFKPENVLLGSGDRVRVCDFGLAREHEAPAPESSLSSPLPDLTRTGTIMGTPAYMAPEQHLGQRPDTRSDQFSFCVALYEALCGQRPWSADTLAALSVTVIRDSPQPLPSSVPSRVRNALLRGLAREPADRFASVEDLLATLDDSSSRRRARWIWGSIAIGATLAGGLAMAPTDDVCSGAQQRLSEVWGSERAEAMAQAIRATAVSYADDVAQTVPAQLDRYGEAWATGYTEACRATHVLGEQSEDLLDRRMACLDRNLLAMSALVEVLSAPDPKSVEEASSAVASLPAVQTCANREVLLASVPPPADPSVATVVEDARAQLASADALREVGRYEQAEALAEQVVDRLETIDYAPALAEALLSVSHARVELGAYDEAIAESERAFDLALANGDDPLAARVAISLAFADGYRRHRAEQGLRWSEHARALVERIGSPPLLRARMLASRGAVLVGQGQLQEALGYYERALQLRLDVHGEDHRDVWTVRGNLAGIHTMLTEYEEAEQLLLQVLAADERILGPRHPKVATDLSNYATVLTQLRRYEDARALFERALSIRKAAVGEDHVEVADILSNLGSTYLNDDQLDTARPYFEQALDIARGHDDAERAATNLGLLGKLEEDLGNLTEARQLYLQALELQRETMGNHPFVAQTLANLAEVCVAMDDYEAARTWSEDAIGVYEQALGADHPELARGLLTLGLALRELDDARAAVGPLERGLAIVGNDRANTRAELSLELARTLWTLGEQLNRARSLASDAAEQFERGGNEEGKEDARAWLSAR